MVRPTKFNKEIAEDIIHARRKGLTMKDCAAIVGVDRTTIRNWLNRGKEQNRGQFHDFYQEFQRATVDFKIIQLDRIMQSKDWKAAQYLLAVTDPEHYSITQHQRLDVNAEVEHKGYEDLINAFREAKKEYK